MRRAYDPATALLVVAVQGDLADPVGGLSVRGSDTIVPYLGGEIE